MAILSGCQTTDQVGTATIITMSKSKIDYYHNYRQKIDDYPRNDMVFVHNAEKEVSMWVGRDNRNGVSYAISEALKACHEGYPSITCKVFDINGRIVWKGVNDELLAQLNNVPAKISVGKSQDYDGAEYKMSLRQNRLFDKYVNGLKGYDHSAFYISSDGVSVGSLNVNGTRGYTLAKDGAHKNCLLKSRNKRCYLFAQDGKPVNEAARFAVYGKN